MRAAGSYSTMLGAHHAAEPLAHVALVEPGRVGDLPAARRGQGRERLEQAGVVPDAGQHGDRAVVEDLHEPVGDGRRLVRLRPAVPEVVGVAVSVVVMAFSSRVAPGVSR